MFQDLMRGYADRDRELEKEGIVYLRQGGFEQSQVNYYGACDDL